MDDARPCEIVVALNPQPSLAVPRPVSDHGVNEPAKNMNSYVWYIRTMLSGHLPCDHDRVDDVRDEVAPLGQRPRHERGRGGREHELEEPLGQLVR